MSKKKKKNKHKEVIVAPTVKKPTAKKVVEKVVVKETEKEIATKNHEPWVNVLSVSIDPEDLTNGSFELDWNDVFIAKLVKAGYRGKDDQSIVDQWFKSVCELIVAEEYEQEIADPEKRKLIKRKELEGGRTEHS